LYYTVINARIHSVSIFSFFLCIDRYFAVDGVELVLFKRWIEMQLG